MCATIPCVALLFRNIATSPMRQEIHSGNNTNLLKWNINILFQRRILFAIIRVQKPAMTRMNLILSSSALYHSGEAGLQLWNGGLKPGIKWSRMVLTITRSSTRVQHTRWMWMSVRRCVEPSSRVQPSLLNIWDLRIQAPPMFPVTTTPGHIQMRIHIVQVDQHLQVYIGVKINVMWISVNSQINIHLGLVHIIWNLIHRVWNHNSIRELGGHPQVPITFRIGFIRVVPLNSPLLSLMLLTYRWGLAKSLLLGKRRLWLLFLRFKKCLTMRGFKIWDQSLLPQSSQGWWEKIVKNYLWPAPDDHSMDDQFAFHQTGSTTAALVYLLHNVYTMFEQGNDYVRCIMVDFSKAFDVINHPILLRELGVLGLNVPIYSWIADLLTGKTQAVKSNSFISKFKPISRSIVQGSVLGPKLFIALARKLKTISTKNKIPKYADDVSLLTPQHTDSSAEDEFRHIADWSSDNKLIINVKKTKEIIFWRSSKCAKKYDIPEIPGIERVDQAKLLGVILTIKYAVLVSPCWFFAIHCYPAFLST